MKRGAVVGVIFVYVILLGIATAAFGYFFALDEELYIPADCTGTDLNCVEVAGYRGVESGFLFILTNGLSQNITVLERVSELTMSSNSCDNPTAFIQEKTLGQDVWTQIDNVDQDSLVTYGPGEKFVVRVVCQNDFASLSSVSGRVTLNYFLLSQEFEKESSFTFTNIVVSNLDAIPTPNQLVTECNDGYDNDFDGVADTADPGCADTLDDSESQGFVITQCNDGIDNNGDGLIDFGSDPTCDSNQDDTEGIVQDCEGSPDYVFTYDVGGAEEWFVLGQGCEQGIDPPQLQSQKIVNVNSGTYEVFVIAERGPQQSGECETEEEFTLSVSGSTSGVSSDDSIACEVSTRRDAMGVFSFNTGNTNIMMRSEARCPPDMYENKVYITKVCLYRQ